MVGLVVVSHSPALATAAVDLAMAMVSGKPVAVAIAAGAAVDGSFGTDAITVKSAIEQVDDGDGVVVLMDLGSAVLSTETALDFIDPELRRRVHLTAAPLVEGLVAAVVQAAAGEPAEVVAGEAAAGLSGKEAHLGKATEAPAEPVAATAAGERATFTVTMPHGLHARPAAKLVTAAKRFDATVQIRNATTGSDFAPAASLSRAAAIGARLGHEVEVLATGNQAGQALAYVLALAERNFDENLGEASPASPVGKPSVGPLAASPGIAFGPKWTIGTRDIEVPVRADPVDPQTEWQKLKAAVESTRKEIAASRARLSASGGEENAAILHAHELLLDDEEISCAVKTGITGGASAGASWKTVLQNVEAEWAALDDPYMTARAADVRAVCNQVLRQLLGTTTGIESQQGILVASELAPAETAQLDTDLVTGIVTAHGSPTSHAAILARALGIPAVVAAGDAVLDVADGTNLVIDGADGTLLLDPPADIVDTYRARADEQAAAGTVALARADEPAETTDGAVVDVAASIGSAADVGGVAGSGADAVGVLRTEFFFINRSRPPSAQEQEAEYRRIAEAIDGLRLTIRTLDAGGDKPLGYLPVPHEDNPFLGTRGIRLSLHHPDVLRQQLTAIVRVAHDHPVSVMFPMVTAVAELEQALETLDSVCGEQGGRPENLEVGMMVEVPAVAANASAFTSRVDFVSVGTNDLAQYALAAERGNEHVAHLADALDPGVLRLVHSVTTAADETTKVAVCGELASDLTAVPVLVGLGIDELSVSRFAISGVKEEIRRWSLADAEALAIDALSLDSAGAVRALVAGRR